MYLPEEIIYKIFSVLDWQCHSCKLKIKHYNKIYKIMRKNYTQFVFCSEECYNF